jgi:FtsZ-binding cell division protein ZapB
MSLVRKPSKNTLRLTPDDLSTCLDQKNGIISVLQCEIEELRSNQEKYDRIKEELMRAKNRYETLLRDHV